MELNNDTLRKLRGLILYTVILVAAAVNYKGILSVGQTLLGFTLRLFSMCPCAILSEGFRFSGP